MFWQLCGGRLDKSQPMEGDQSNGWWNPGQGGWELSWVYVKWAPTPWPLSAILLSAFERVLRFCGAWCSQNSHHCEQPTTCLSYLRRWIHSVATLYVTLGIQQDSVSILPFPMATAPVLKEDCGFRASSLLPRGCFSPEPYEWHPLEACSTQPPDHTRRFYPNSVLHSPSSVISRSNCWPIF